MASNISFCIFTRPVYQNIPTIIDPGKKYFPASKHASGKFSLQFKLTTKGPGLS